MSILGTDGTSPGGVPYSVYRAIPYALPPLGDRRFAKPVAHPGPGEGRVFNATSPGYICPQKITPELRVLLNEDCLTLNVYVPVSNNAAPKTVMIWIHGGGFTQGSALEYTPSELVTTKDVIVVVIQYRLDILGFLSSGDDVIPGNYGLWDQALAIKWVKDNIQAFGGDPNDITVFGLSAGAASVGYQMLSPVNKGINFRVILQSGTPLSFWAFTKNPAENFYKVANGTGCMSTASLADRIYYTVAGGRQKAEHENILKCLKGKDVITLLQALESSTDILDSISTIPWVPSIDGEFLLRDPATLLSDVTYLADVGATTRDVMIGMNNDESGFLLSMGFLQQATDPSDEVERQADSFPSNENFIRTTLTNELLFRYGEGLRQDRSRMETLLNVLEFFYTQPLNGGEVQLQVLCMVS
ncbi:neuroligin-4, Y-linked-like [Babylonia areolata]|uniref:neuroligin-4, Y-linked-like n=1 Tax=Babylonia areolata TaxID=304850 RepID=UPI003FD5F450